MRNLNAIKGVFCGSGSAAMQKKEVIDHIVHLTNKCAKDINVLYIGTATYDLLEPFKKQTFRFSEAGCQVSDLKCATEKLSIEFIQNKFQNIDVVVVSGGNTVYAINRWKQLGVDKFLEKAMDSGVVMTGGSFGAICWFDAGHSDSMDPATYKNSMLKVDTKDMGDESQLQPLSKEWKYIRAPCLGFIPGLVCPHFDQIQSNGVLRALDFDQMLMRHQNEYAICIDHWAGIILKGDGNYEILSLKEEKGSVSDDNQFSPGQGSPGVWLKFVDNQIITKLCPQNGKIIDLFKSSSNIQLDPLVEQCIKENPFEQ